MFDIQYPGISQRGPEHRHISLCLELLTKVILYGTLKYPEMNRFDCTPVGLYFEKSLNLCSKTV